MKMERMRRTPATVLRKVIGNERGNALVTVVVIITAVLLVASALYIMAVGEGDLVEYSVDSAKAFYIAEAGQQRARCWLEEKANDGQYPDEASLESEYLGEGTYDISLTKVAGLYPWLLEYEVVTRGTVDGVAREVVARIRRETFAQYIYFAGNPADIWFTTGDSLNGRTHVNGEIRISGDPWFGGKVTSTADQMVIQGGSDPTFEAGYELGVSEMELPSLSELSQTIVQQAQQDGVFRSGLRGRSARYEVTLGMSDGYLSYRSYERRGWWGYQYSDWTHVRIEDTNGVFVFVDEVHIEGTLDGQATIASGEDMYITDDIIYEDSTPGQGPNPGADDLLGLVSAKNIIVADNAANRNDCEIHAHMMALDESFTVENYQWGDPRGDLTVYGGFAQKRMGPIGTFYHGYGITSGYNKDYHFDRNMTTQSPPSYPQTDDYIVVDWEERPVDQS
ncbi:MAG: DUF4900 domain-containing protein [Candidatus Eisenbacteria bacterium]|nr:DUF4900 domain-containing protein [Candidatus Eisenbacteria bacterium]